MIFKKFELYNPEINPIGPWGLFGVYGDFGRSKKWKLRPFLNIFASHNFFCFVATLYSIDRISFAIYSQKFRQKRNIGAKALNVQYPLVLGGTLCCIFLGHDIFSQSACYPEQHCPGVLGSCAVSSVKHCFWAFRKFSSRNFLASLPTFVPAPIMSKA